MDLGALWLTPSVAAAAGLAARLLAESAHPFVGFFRQRRAARGRGS